MKLHLWSPEGTKPLTAYTVNSNGMIHAHGGQTIPPHEADDLILAMGGQAHKIIEATGCIPKNRTVTSLRGKLFQLPGGGKFMVTYSPSIHEIDYDKGLEMLCDVQLARRYLQTGSLDPQPGKYQVVSDLGEFIAEVESKHEATRRPVPVALDLETMGSNPYNPAKQILAVTLSHTPRTAVGLHLPVPSQPSKAQLVQLEWIMTTSKVSLRGANLKYDLLWLVEKWGLESTNFKFDTVLVGSLLDENRSNSLKNHAWHYTTMGGYSDAFDTKYDKSALEGADPNDLMMYGMADADATIQVANAQSPILQSQPNLCRFYVKILHPAARAYEKVERRGVYVDKQAYKEFEVYLKQEILRLEQQAMMCIPRRLRAKWGDDAKLSKAKFICEFMFSPLGLDLKPRMVTAKTGAPSTAMEHLESFHNDERARPFVSALKEYNSATKMMSTYVTGFLAHLREDGKFHPSYFLANQGDGFGGTVTGRLSARDPAFQTVPKHSKLAKMLRKCFKAPPGFVILGPDYSQGELRIAACLANEPTMIETYAQGVDLHAKTGAGLAGYDLDEFMALKKTDKETFDGIRQRAKAANFGLLYGMGAMGYQAYAETSYGVSMSLEEAERDRNAFFNTYATLPAWHNECKVYARKHKQIHNPLGRVRHLPLISSPNREVAAKSERQAVNSPVQSTLSDLSLWATALMNQEYGMGMDGFCVYGMVHDQLLAYAPEDEAELWAGRLQHMMENLPFHEVEWEPQLKFNADMSIGHNLAELQDWGKPGDWNPNT